ncbi:MAG TPA: DUF2784 domain-containing protein, partial [Burkholderiales bacterium]|nr:DUF2784 domain-containing protein [Burkholderiales bacterium]
MGPPADLILVLHTAYVLFVVGGLMLIWLGVWAGWRWVRGFWFRLLHLAAVGLVALEALVGVTCPLTVLEDWLRSGAYADAGFIERWLHRFLFWDLPAWVFTLTYLAFALMVVMTWLRWPPTP